MSIQVIGDEADTNKVPLLYAPAPVRDQTVVVPRFDARDLATSYGGTWKLWLLAAGIFACGMLAGAALVWRLAVPRTVTPVVTPLG
jgi:hypothetical protein